MEEIRQEPDWAQETVLALETVTVLVPGQEMARALAPETALVLDQVLALETVLDLDQVLAPALEVVQGQAPVVEHLEEVNSQMNLLIPHLMKE